MAPHRLAKGIEVLRKAPDQLCKRYERRDVLQCRNDLIGALQNQARHPSRLKRACHAMGYEVRKGQAKAHQIPTRRAAKVHAYALEVANDRNDFHPSYHAGNKRNRRENEGRAVTHVVAACHRCHGIADDKACEEEHLAYELYK